MAKYPTLTLGQILPHIDITKKVQIVTKVWNPEYEEFDPKVLFEGDVEDVSWSLEVMCLDSEDWPKGIRACFSNHNHEPYIEINVKESE